MITVNQTITKPPLGNCYAACIASVFEVALEEVPHPSAEEGADGPGFARYEGRLQQRFFGPRGLAKIQVLATAPETGERWVPPGYSILSAQSPRGAYEHAVVCLDGEIVHDPSPDRHMGVGEWMSWSVFVEVDPSNMQPPLTWPRVLGLLENLFFGGPVDLSDVPLKELVSLVRRIKEAKLSADDPVMR